MEKVFLKPTAQEINFKTTEPNTFIDGFEYTPRDNREKPLGHLYVLGQVKYGEENMAYVLSLVSSLAKREYYAENGTMAEDPKKALDNTLKKLNDVLEDFFKNKDLKLNIGLVAIAGEHIFIAKLGKFKVFLARSGEIIDILNNVNLFQKEHVQEKQFANIISGRLQSGDKIFALSPTRHTTLKEKLIKNHLLEKAQDQFLAELAAWGQNGKSFPCCGFHIELKKVKEEDITIKSAYEKSRIILTAPSETAPAPKAAERAEIPAPQAPQIISADISLSKRKNSFEKMQERWAKELSFRFRWNGKKAVGVLVIIFLVGLGWMGKKFILDRRTPEALGLKSAQENLQLAESKLADRDPNGARELLGLSLSSLSSLSESKKAAEVKARVNAILDRLDLVSNRQPELWLDLGNVYLSKLLIAKENELLGIGEQKIFKLSGGQSKELATLPLTQTNHLFLNAPYFSVYNGEGQVNILNLETGKLTEAVLPEPVLAKDAFSYEGNLYLIGGNTVYKYNDGLVSKQSQKQAWYSGLAEQDPLAIAVDGNAYVLTSQGQIIKLFRGQETGRLNLNFRVGKEIQFFTDKDSAYFYITDPPDKKVRLFDKNTGTLVMTYKFNVIPEIKDFAVNNKGAFALTSDNKVWKIDLAQ